MNLRERFLCALRHEEPDQVPYWDYSIADNVVQALAGRKLSAKEVGRMFDRVDLEYWRKPPDFAVYSSPEGGGRSFLGDGLIRTRADLPLMVFPDPAPTQEIEAALRLIESKEDFAVGLVISCSADVMLSSMGFDGFSYALYDDPGLITEVVQRFVDWTLAMLDAFQDLGFDYILSGDDIAYKTAPFFSPEVFRDLLMPGMQQVAQAIHLPWIFHSDGNLMPILDDLLSLGIDGLNPIEPLAMDIFELKRLYGERLCLVGNIDVNNLSLGTPESVREEVRQKIQALAPGGGYIAASSNSIPDYVRPENFMAMIEAIREFGRYPIAGAT